MAAGSARSSEGGAGLPTDAEACLGQAARLVEAYLEQVLPAPGGHTPRLAEAVRYSALGGGKRLRPALALGAAEACGGAPELALPVAAAVEMIHTYSLIHDDLPAMDDDALRRGKPTLHVVYGEGVAILAGDGLLAEAFALLAREPADSGRPDLTSRKLRVVGRIAEAAGAAGMVGGQAIDLLAVGHSHGVGAIGAAALRDMHARKTGALIRAAAVSGAIMAGAAETRIDAVDRFASHLGLAFQIVDDVLDVEGEARELGKTAGKDAAAGKPTYPALFGLDASKRMARDAADAAVAALAAEHFERSRLAEIAQWVVSRSS
jgi:geranylgeranyl pyrophosphate synthase